MKGPTIMVAALMLVIVAGMAWGLWVVTR